MNTDEAPFSHSSTLAKKAAERAAVEDAAWLKAVGQQPEILPIGRDAGDFDAEMQAAKAERRPFDALPAEKPAAVTLPYASASIDAERRAALLPNFPDEPTGPEINRGGRSL